ncbi:stage VI sporulation protein D [Virgibacillus sp. SK37]|uniref:stage VI sporulation protein D n=1 Tax=Virgibacillus sp. SK37 TaxID=403957 RepID=UPI0004D12F34|nr:stage VI sporulation protein D [Virgibacillus sp. SK37]AIF43296.1 stage VI sporulation protein D [Virgibacillus sp. SK37]
MANESSVFSFELNESLYFEKGQEVSEMRGISLDPEISIQPFNEYISIRGVIELQGEYVKESQIEDRENRLDYDTFQSKRFVERIMDNDDGTLEFTHRFPVEISVPTYRVENLEEVRVYIESFDYELPEKDHLKFYSTVQIHGVNQLVESVENRSNSEEVEQEEESSEGVRQETFEFEIKPDNESTNELDAADEDQEIPDLPTSLRDDETSEEGEEENNIEEDDKGNRWKYKETKTLTQFFEDLSSKEELSVEDQEVPTSNMSDDSPSVSYDSPSTSHEIMESNTSREVEDVSYLSDMFRHSEEEQYSKMRLCFVQPNDTIETIAERYQITTLQLIKQNRLDEEYDVSEGQLLYIPHTKK